MKFLVILFPIIATALAASISPENSNVVREPSLTMSVPVAMDNTQSRNYFAFVNLIQALKTSTQMYFTTKNVLINYYFQCVFNPDSCIWTPTRSESTTTKVDSLESALEKFVVRDIPQTNSFDESFMFPPASTSAKNAVNPNNQRLPFPVTVPTYWNPYVNVPLIAFQNEMPNAAYPYAGSFIPY
ncbi:hypothetical protein GHT06_009733 [Daphnia sinensis]|uniref:Uncharacterized protein n=1 Tax=Daphnia sinensis TaxID=1820382 RepID=A0AAD5Q3Y5_9CRUS|nr:hypothetical protein GHT06_009733 [Daphnia sinensis]